MEVDRYWNFGGVVEEAACDGSVVQVDPRRQDFQGGSV